MKLAVLVKLEPSVIANFLWRGFRFVGHTGDEGETILYVKVVPDFGACCGNVLVGGRGQYGQGFVSIEGMDLEAINISMHELGKITKVCHQLVPNLVICLNSLTAKSCSAGAKLILFGRYVLNFYVGIVL